MTGEVPKVGATVDGKYRIEHTLGKGGMGLVLAARHVHLGHLVAIKFPVSSRMLSDSAVERLLREAPDFADALVTAAAFPTTKAESVRRIATGALFLDPATERSQGDREHGTTTPPESGTAPPRDPSWNDGAWRHSDTPSPVTARSAPTKRNLTNVRGLALAALGLAISLALGLARYHRFISGPEIRLGSASVWTAPRAVRLTTATSPVDDKPALIASPSLSAPPAPSATSGLRAVPLRKINSPASAKPRLPLPAPRDPLAEPD